VILDQPKRVVSSYDLGSTASVIRFANKETLQFVAKPKELRNEDDGGMSVGWLQVGLLFFGLVNSLSRPPGPRCAAISMC
jgi:hypothetical protein